MKVDFIFFIRLLSNRIYFLGWIWVDIQTTK